MLSVQPIQLWRYVGVKRNKIPMDLRRLFYLSWEDAFWDLLDKKHISKKSRILLPDLWCKDVVLNIKKRGYKVFYYHFNNDLSCDKIDFLAKVKEYKPQVVIVFHPVGIKSNLFKNRNWINRLPDDVLLIEDSVHKIVNPNSIRIYKKNHFVIDSLRKVIPLQGSNLYGRKGDLDFNGPSHSQSFIYSIKVHLLWFLMIVAWNIGLYKFAEKLMIIGYDLIGDSEEPARGFVLFRFLFEFIDYDKIYKAKKRQIKIYNNHLKSTVKLDKSDWQEMRGYPLVLNNISAKRILKYLRAHNLTVRFELNESRWTRKRKLVYLPLGPFINDDQIGYISRLVLKSFEYEQPSNRNI